MNYPIPCFNDKYHMATDRDRNYKFSPYFSAWEFMSPTTNQVYMLKTLIDILTTVREETGSPLYINRPDFGRTRRGVRPQEDQNQLIKMGLTKSRMSAHQYGCAVDMDVPPQYTKPMLITLIRRIEKDLGLEPSRIGYHSYKGKWIHIDRVFEQFAGDGCNSPEDNPFPASWRPGVEW